MDLTLLRAFVTVAPEGNLTRAAARLHLTPPTSAHHRLLSRIFSDIDVTPFKVAEVDQEPSMLDLVKSGVGLTLARDSIAIAEAHAHGLTIVDGVTVPAALAFITLAERRDEPAIAAALRLIEQQWA